MLRKKGGRENFIEGVLHHDLKALLLPILNKNKKKNAVALRAQLLGERFEPILGPNQITPEMKNFREFFSASLEIIGCLDNLRYSVDFIKCHPPRKKNLPSHEYLRYHVTHFLQELYILKERVKKHGQYVRKKLQKIGDSKQDIENIDDSLRGFESSVSNYLNSRGIHVHQRRFTSIGFDQLGSIEWVARVTKGADDGFAELSMENYRHLYSEMRDKWVIKLTSILKVTENALDNFFENAISPSYKKIRSACKE